MPRAQQPARLAAHSTIAPLSVVAGERTRELAGVIRPAIGDTLTELADRSSDVRLGPSSDGLERGLAAGSIRQRNTASEGNMS